MYSLNLFFFCRKKIQCQYFVFYLWMKRFVCSSGSNTISFHFQNFKNTSISILFGSLWKPFYFNSFWTFPNTILFPFQNFTNTIPFQFFIELHKYYFTILILFGSLWIPFYFYSFQNFTNTIPFQFFIKLHKYYCISILFGSLQILFHLIFRRSKLLFSEV